jgi:hypothetical protein
LVLLNWGNLCRSGAGRAPILRFDVILDPEDWHGLFEPRRAAGYAIVFLRIHRIRWGKPVGEADSIEVREKLLA